ncbi:hypothetical protein ZWY2020_031344 [Hordeum vulgare]|nr:hypothetical protein ZWY2020_031344 [Hordeum vulgare]
MRVSPGLSSFAADTARVAESLRPLMEFAKLRPLMVPATGEHCQENQEAATPPSYEEEEEQDSEERTESRGSPGMRHRPADEEEAVMVKQQDEQQVEEEHDDHRVHGLELEAYVSVMKAFYFTGPLTWAKEELLSDLRLQLHVSSDEHTTGESEDSGAPLDANKGTREQALAVLDGVLYADTGINDLSPQPT